MAKWGGLIVIVCIVGGFLFWMKRSDLPSPQQRTPAAAAVISDAVPAPTQTESVVPVETKNLNGPAPAVTSNVVPHSLSPKTSPSEPKTVTVPMTSVSSSQAPVSQTSSSELEEPQSTPVVFIAAEEKTNSSAELHKLIWLRAGLNGNYQTLKHSLDGGADSSFKSSEGPGYSISTGFEIDRFGLDLLFENNPGQVSSSVAASVVGGNYNWQTLRAMGTWRLSSHSNWKLHAGVQQDTSPLLYPDATNLQVYFRRVRLTQVALGAEYAPPFSNGSRFVGQFHYLYPVDAATLDRAHVSVEPQPQASLSIGRQYLIGGRMYIGLQGKFQLQDYEFSYRDRPETTKVTGKQRLSSTALELQIGWEF